MIDIGTGVITALQPSLLTGLPFPTFYVQLTCGGVALILIAIALLVTPKRPPQKEGSSYRELASQLSEVAGKSEVVINAINDGVIALDGQGIIQLINPAAQELLGWSKQDAMGLGYKTIIKVIDSKNEPVVELNNPIIQSQQNNTVVKTDTFSLQTHSGKSFLAYISVSPVGQPGSGVIVVFRDITTEKSDERQRAEFISTASHEMRTPVASIEGYLGLALNPQTATIDDKAREFITKAHESAQHLGNLFADLLDVSKADDHRLKNDPTVIDIVPFIHGIAEGLTPKAIEKGLTMLYKPVPDGNREENRRLNPVYYVNVDNDHLREVADNLIENAIKYTLKGSVIIDVAGSNDKVVLSIADTGIGIPREDQAHLFQKFYRVDNSDTREIGGTGLGLYLCRRLAEAMGGRIWVESEYQKGSTFFVELPRLANDEATRLIEEASIDAERRATVESTKAPQQPQSAPDVLPPLEPGSVQPAAPSPTTPDHANPENIPLTAIEAHPNQFVRPRDTNIVVPPRQ